MPSSPCVKAGFRSTNSSHHIAVSNDAAALVKFVSILAKVQSLGQKKHTKVRSIIWFSNFIAAASPPRPVLTMTTFKCGWSDVSRKCEDRRFLLAEKTQLQTDVNDNINIISSKKSEPAIKRIMLGEKELVEDLEESIAMLL